ncbi:MAG: S26 family signal peptidase [DPANN group archaeon]|nr:S26 family signal peptidase [DPANN group archaeon]
MLPNFKEGDYALVSKIYFSLKAGDVIVFEKNNVAMIKRIEKVEDGKYFVEGDNKPESEDSRQFGPVGRKHVVGKVFARI